MRCGVLLELQADGPESVGLSLPQTRDEGVMQRERREPLPFGLEGLEDVENEATRRIPDQEGCQG
jgi:hypothetical protein